MTSLASTERGLLALALAVWLSACASTQQEERKPLPFHVAVIPIVNPRLREATQGPGERAGGVTAMRLQPNLVALSRTVVRVLDGRVFTRATLLEPELSNTAGESSPAGGPRDRMREARAIDADLVLECELDYDPTIRQEANANFWLNLPLFLLGGPFCYFVKDRSYSADVELLGSFYDVHAIDGESVHLGDRLARILFTNARFQGVDLNFITRAQGNLTKYAVSILIPAGFLAKESDPLAQELEEEVSQTLSSEFARSVQQKRENLVHAQYLAPFWLDSDHMQVEREADGRVRVRGRVHLVNGTSAERMTRYRLRTDEHSVEGEFAADAPDSGAGRPSAYEIYERLEAPDGTTTIKLDLEAGTRNRFLRTYTLAIPPSTSVRNGTASSSASP